jgi:hypothetical protein
MQINGLGPHGQLWFKHMLIHQIGQFTEIRNYTLNQKYSFPNAGCHQIIQLTMSLCQNILTFRGTEHSGLAVVSVLVFILQNSP